MASHGESLDSKSEEKDGNGVKQDKIRHNGCRRGGDYANSELRPTITILEPLQSSITDSTLEVHDMHPLQHTLNPYFMKIEGHGDLPHPRKMLTLANKWNTKKYYRFHHAIAMTQRSTYNSKTRLRNLLGQDNSGNATMNNDIKTKALANGSNLRRTKTINLQLASSTPSLLSSSVAHL